MSAGIFRTTRTAVALATVLMATNARANEYGNLKVLEYLGYGGAISVAIVNLGFTAHDIKKAARGEYPGAGVAFAEMGVMAVELAAISAVSVALDPPHPLPVFAASLWPPVM